MNKYKITLYSDYDLQFYFFIKQDRNLLHVLENNGIKIESQCRSGFCATCRVLLKSGKIKYINSIIGTSNKYEILSCSCYPITDIVIDINYNRQYNFY